MCKKKEEEKKPPSPAVMQRHCQDKLCCIIFLVFIAGCGVCFAMVLPPKGNINKLMQGIDEQGLICGVDVMKGESQLQWQDIGVRVPNELWITTTTLLGETVPLSKALPNISLGEPDGWVFGLPNLSKTMCMHKCPDTGLDFGEGISTGLLNWLDDPIKVRGYKGEGAKTFADLEWFDTRIPQQKTEKLGAQCFPPLTGYLGEMTKDLMNMIKGSGPMAFMMNLAKDFINAWDMLALGILVTILGGFLQMFFIKLPGVAACIIYGMIALLMLFLAALMVFAHIQYDKYMQVDLNCPIKPEGFAQPGDCGGSVQSLQILRCFLALMLVLQILFLFFKRNAIRVAKNVVKCSAEAMGDLPGLLALPLVAVIYKIIFIPIFLYFMALTQSTGEAKAVDLPGAPGGLGRSFVLDPVFEKIGLFELFMLLWVLAFAIAWEQLTTSLAVATWYFFFENGNRKKELKDDEGKMVAAPTSPVFSAMKNAIRQQLGSIAFGSFLVAVVEWLKIMLELQADQVTRAFGGKENKFASCMLNCVRCILNCLDRCVKWINKTAYIQIAIKDTNFCSAVCGGLKLVIANWAEVAFAAICGGCFGLLGKICITLSGPAVVQFWLTNMDETPISKYPVAQMAEPMAFVVLLLILSQFFASIFISIFQLVIDTILFCYIISKADYEGNQGPKSICEHVKEANDAEDTKGKEKREKKDKNQDEMKTNKVQVKPTDTKE